MEKKVNVLMVIVVAIFIVLVLITGIVMTKQSNDKVIAETSARYILKYDGLMNALDELCDDADKTDTEKINEVKDLVNKYNESLETAE